MTSGNVLVCHNNLGESKEAEKELSGFETLMTNEAIITNALQNLPVYKFEEALVEIGCLTAILPKASPWLLFHTK